MEVQTFRMSALVLFVLLSQGCKHPLAIEGEGDIVDESSSGYGCTLEQFRSEDIACTENEVSGDYKLSYQAVPREGWRFVKWQGFCSPLSVEPACLVDTPAAAVALWDSLYPDIGMPTTTAVFEPEGALALYRDQVAEIDQYLRDIEFSGSVLVSVGDDTLLARGYGLADREKGHTNRLDTRFFILSVTKTFTAASIMLLEERQQLSTDDQLCDYLEECPAAWQAMTLHQLLTHTSGLPNYVDSVWESDDYGLLWTLEATETEVLEALFELPLEFVPGADRAYSNSAYFLLGKVIEAASGTSYAQFLQDNIFGPLGMGDTGIVLANRSNFAAGYHADSLVPKLSSTTMKSSGGIYSTVLDLQRWERAMHSDVLLSDSAREKYLMIYVDVPCPGACTRGQTYGWNRENWSGIEVLWKDGWNPGWSSMLISSFQDEHPSVIVLQNTTGGGPYVVPVALDIGRMISGHDPRG